MEQARRLHPDFDVTRSWKLPDVKPFPDEDLGAYLTRIGFTADQLQYARRSFVNAAGDAIQYFSAEAALAEMHDTSCGEGDFRIVEGYDRLTDHLAQGLDIRLNTVVREIEWSGNSVRVITDGEVFEAENVIITLPLGVLQSGAVVFNPGLPAEKLDVLQHLRMGQGFKMVYRFDEPIMPKGIMALYSALNPPMWWTPSAGHTDDYRVWTTLATGDWARELLHDGIQSALAKGLKTLQTELERPDLKPLDQHFVDWPGDPFALGAYSMATPGYADARLELAKPINGRLFWAGEATAPHGYAATVHGAYTSGRRAAKEILSTEY